MIFNIEEHEHNIYMPNEIFSDLVEHFEDEDKKKSSTHIAYAYTYTWLAYYMYRYCKYDYDIDYHSQLNINEKMIKQILGFPAKSDQYTYITKKGGILDELGYICKESDVPIEPVIVNAEGEYILERYSGKGMSPEVELAEAAKSGGEFKISHFRMESYYKTEIDDDGNEVKVSHTYSNSKNRKINFPIKGFFRDDESCDYEGEYEERTGTFWQIQNTHMIDIDVFVFCMADAELGVKGFYLYSYLLYMCDKHYNSFDCSIGRFVTLTGLGERTVRDQLVRLEKRNMITNDHKPYCLDKKSWQTPKANTYEVLPYSKFVSDVLDYNEIPEQRKISVKRYEEEIGFVNYEEDFEKDTEENKLIIGDSVVYTNTFTHQGITYDLCF